MLENLKLGAIEGASALIVILALIISAAAILAILIVNGMKLVKERRDAQEDKAENEFFAEYGITGEEMRLNQQLADMRDKLSDKRRFKKELLEAQRTVVVRETVEEHPVAEEAPVEESVAEAAQEPVQEPVAKVAPEPVPEPVAEAPQQPEPAEPVAEETKKAVTPKKAPKKKDDWSKYEGEFEGVYYDPEDACYYEGSAPPELAKKLAAKQKEFEAKAKKDKKEVIVKKIVPPFLALKTPKNPRQTPKKVDGFDESVIYGKYVVEHVDKEDGAHEYFYTLYNPSGKAIYESSNYCELEYCKRAIVRFKSHVLIGEFTINAADLKFFFELKRKTYIHKGLPQDNYEAANALINEVRSYAQTDIVREQ